MALGEVMLELAQIDGGRDRLHSSIEDGSAFEKLIEVTRAHGGDPAVLHDTSRLPTAPNEGSLLAQSDGYVSRCDSLIIGTVATRLGAGRERKEDHVDPGVGITVEAKIGDAVRNGDILAGVRYRDERLWEAYKGQLATAWEISPAPVTPPPLVIERIS
jgi:thymidine phosphorylase